MRRKSRITRFLAPVFERNADTILADNWLVLQPVHHVFRGIILDRTSMKGVFYARWGVTHMFSRQESPPLIGFVLEGGTGHPDFFELPEEQISQILCERVETKTLPYLRTLGDIEAYYRFRMDDKPSLTAWPIAHFRVEVAMGHFDVARELAAKHRKWWFTDRAEWSDEERQVFGRLRLLCNHLDKEDHASIADLLTSWEAVSAQNFKIQHIWRPSPFPFEPTYGEEHPSNPVDASLR